MKTIRQLIPVAALAVGVGGMWGLVAAVCAKFVFNLEEVQALLYAGLPTTLVAVVFLWNKLLRVLGFDE